SGGGAFLRVWRERRRRVVPALDRNRLGGATGSADAAASGCRRAVAIILPAAGVYIIMGAFGPRGGRNYGQGLDTAAVCQLGSGGGGDTAFRRTACGGGSAPSLAAAPGPGTDGGCDHPGGGAVSHDPGAAARGHVHGHDASQSRLPHVAAE